MRRVRAFTTLVMILLISSLSMPALAQFSSSYNYYINLSREAVDKHDYQSLLFFVESAHLADPQADEPFDLIKELPIYQNNVYVLKGYLLQAVQALERKHYRSALFYFELSLLVTPDDGLIKEYIVYVNKLIKGEIVDEKPLIKRIKREYKIELPIQAEVKKKKEATKDDEQPQEPKEFKKLQEPKEPKEPKKSTIYKSPVLKQTVAIEATVKNVIMFDENLWKLQPNTVLEIEFDQSIIMEGKNISRFLVLDQDYVIVERLDSHRIKITSRRRGSTIFHVWDDTGRWTFNIRGVIRAVEAAGFAKSKKELWEEYVKPFRLFYSNNWGGFYRGDSFDTLSRRNLNFTQKVGIYGETPYGEFDASANFFKFDNSTENTGRAVGLTNGKIGPFEDFSVRGWDTYKRFSTLSLPGRYFRGGKIDAYAFDHKLLWSYIHGQDRATFVEISEGVTQIRRSFIQGGRMTLYPDTEHQYSMNFGRGWGEERSDVLKKKVFSFDTEHQLGDLNVKAETAYDEDVHAHIINTKYEKENYSWRWNMRHIDEDFVTLTSRPSNQGVTGGNIFYDWKPDSGISFSSNIELFQNHDIPNPDNQDGLNYEASMFVNVPLTDTMHWNSSAFYSDTPQLIAPRENINVNTSLNKSFKILEDRTLSTFIGATHQRSRFKFSPESEYDRTTLRAGFRFPLLKRLSYFLNYDYSYVDPKAIEGINRPHVLSTGLSYNQTFKDKVSMRASVSFRDEEDTDGRFSFLSGTDILRANLGLSYRPTPDYEIFVDGSYRNVWAERNDQAAFNDADVRFGVRASWDLLFRWDPATTVSGFAFKDYNQNGIRDAGEEGIPEIRVRVGNKIAITNRQGFYTKETKAKSVKVAVKLDSIPQGYSITNDLSKRYNIEQGKRISQDFGFSVRTEIYGVVFIDTNSNSRHDAGEKTIPGVELVLDGKRRSVSDFEGIYTFYDLQPGEHVLKINVNSIPLELLPRIKLKHSLLVEEGSSLSFNVPLKSK